MFSPLTEVAKFTSVRIFFWWIIFYKHMLFADVNHSYNGGPNLCLRKSNLQGNKKFEIQVSASEAKDYEQPLIVLEIISTSWDIIGLLLG